MLTDNEVQLLNNLIFEAVKHGADSGGSYDSNEDGLLHAMDDIAERYGIYERYETQKVEVKNWVVLQFVEK